MNKRIETLEKALGVAMKQLSRDIPGDSRAVPDWFVACAAVLAGFDDQDQKIEQCLNENLMLEINQKLENVICEFVICK